jgi:predicted RNA binding protein YcfA (HicA-like mRNA interferase family)
MKLPRDVNGDEAARALTHLGFSTDRQSGSHLIMRRGSQSISVPQHRPIKPGTLRAILRQANLTVEQFMEAL